LDPTFGLIHVSPAPSEVLSLFGLTKHQQTIAPWQKNTETATRENTTKCASAGTQIVVDSVASDVKTDEKHSPIEINESTPFVQMNHSLETKDCSSTSSGDKANTTDASFQSDLELFSIELDTSESDFCSDQDSILDSICRPSNATDPMCSTSPYSLGIAH
jgi:hypothetical protein